MPLSPKAELVSAPHPAKNVAVGKVVLELGVVARTGANLKSGTVERELVNRIRDRIRRADDAQIASLNRRYVRVRIIDAIIAKRELIDLLAGEDVSPRAAEEARVHRNVQREIQVRGTGRRPVGRRQTASSEWLESVGVAEEKAHGARFGAVAGFAVPVGSELIITEAPRIAAIEVAAGNRRDQKTIGARAKLVSFGVQELADYRIDFRAGITREESS